MPDQDHTTSVEYREIERFKGFRFGSDGSIQSCWRLTGFAKDLRLVIGTKWRDVTAHATRVGYLRVWIREEGERQRHLVHRLILEAFRGPCPDGMESRHLDDNRTNNCISNLAWGTRSENTVDQVKSGTHHVAKLTPEDVREIRAKFKTGRSRRSIAQEYGIDPSTIWHLIAGNTWTHVE